MSSREQLVDHRGVVLDRLRSGRTLRKDLIGAVLVHKPLGDGLGQLILRIEVVIEGAGREARLRQDLAGRRRTAALRQGHRNRGVDQPTPGDRTLLLRDLRHDSTLNRALALSTAGTDDPDGQRMAAGGRPRRQ